MTQEGPRILWLEVLPSEAKVALRAPHQLGQQELRFLMDLATYFLSCKCPPLTLSFRFSSHFSSAATPSSTALVPQPPPSRSA